MAIAELRAGGEIQGVFAEAFADVAWRGKLTDAQAWQLAAYIRAMSGDVGKDAAPSRREGMAAAPPMTQLPDQPPRGGDASAANPPPP